MRNLFYGLLMLSFVLPTWAGDISLQHNGLTVTANLETASENWTTGPVMLITHGTIAHNKMEIIEALQQVFKDRGYSSLAINLGLGISDRKGMYDCKRPHTHKHTDAIDEIGLWMGWLQQQGVKKVTLVGHSRGGNQTAWYAAAHDSDAIQSLLLIAPSTWDEAGVKQGYEAKYGQALPPLLDKANALVAKGKGDSMLSPVDFLYCAQTSATADAFASYYHPDERLHTPVLLKSIEKPVLVFVGSEDKAVPGLEEKMAAVAKRDNITLISIDGADHFFRDLYAEDLADAADEFLQELQ